MGLPLVYSASKMDVGLGSAVNVPNFRSVYVGWTCAFLVVELGERHLRIVQQPMKCSGKVGFLLYDESTMRWQSVTVDCFDLSWRV